MITKQELINRIQADSLSMQFVRFVFDDISPSEIPAQHDENSVALLLLRAVSKGNKKLADELLEPISKRSIGETSVWVNNDLFFAALAISSLKFSMYRDFIQAAADRRVAVSAGGSHRGLAQAVRAAMTGNPDFTESAAIFSLVLTRYMEKYALSNREIVCAYKSFQSYDWDADRHSNVRCAIALRGFYDILYSLDIVSQKSNFEKLIIFAQNFPKRASLISRIIAWGFAAVMIILFLLNIHQSNRTSLDWIILHKVFSSVLGISSILAILSLVPKFVNNMSKFFLWIFNYPKNMGEKQIKES